MGAKEGETKRERFERLSSGRIEKTVRQVRSFGKLSNPYHYEYAGRDAARFYGEVQDELAEACAKFGVDVECTWSVRGRGCDERGEVRRDGLR